MYKFFLSGAAIFFASSIQSETFDALPKDNSGSYKAFVEIDADYANKVANGQDTTIAVAEEVKYNWPAGEEWLQFLKQEFRTGKWKQFLEDTEEEYNINKNNPTFVSRISKNDPKSYAYAYSKLFEKTKAELIQACASGTDPQICTAVNAVINRHKLTGAQIAALDWLNKIATGELPSDTPTENNIKKILQEYRAKHFAVARATVPSDENALAILEFDKYNNLFDVTRGKEENAVINDAYLGFVNIAKSQHDMRYLIDLGRKSRWPHNPTEERVAQVMSNYVSELDHLRQQSQSQ